MLNEKVVAAPLQKRMEAVWNPALLRPSPLRFANARPQVEIRSNSLPSGSDDFSAGK